MKKVDLVSYLCEKDNDFFRKSNDKKNNGYIFDNQINTGRKIVIKLASNTTRRNHVMLVAKMQSGKTGTCNSVINIITKSKLYKNMAINKYMFITGMNDCGLKDQTYQRLSEQVFDANIDNIYNSKRSKRNLSTNKFFILKNSDLLSYDGILDNSLIFIDESHYGSNEKNILTKFLVKHGIDWRNTNELIKRNIYIVSISATPFDEIISDTAKVKDIVELDTDKNYFGVSEFIQNELVFSASKDDISESGEIFTYVDDALNRMNKNNENGVIFIRTQRFNIIKDNEFIKDNFSIYEMDSSNSKIQYDELSNKIRKILEDNKHRKIYNMLNIKPKTKPLIVLIKGAFRAGITIEEEFKKIIYMVYDFSVKADTTAQALLGRLCGYRRNDSDIKNTYFYINKEYANQYSNWEKDFTNRDLIPCENLKYEWVSNEYASDADAVFGSKSCGNFALDLTDEDIKKIYFSCKNKKNRSEIIEPFFNELLKRNNYHIPYNYIGEVHIMGKNNYAKSSQEKRFDSFSTDSLVFQFRPEKISKFVKETNRNILTKDDIGKKLVSLVLDTNIIDEKNDIQISGNKRLLVYYVEVGVKKRMFVRKKQFKPHKNTEL